MVKADVTTYTSENATVQSNVSPYISTGVDTDGDIMLPIRYVAEAIGADVEWDGIKRTVSLTMGYRKYEINVNSTYFYQDVILTHLLYNDYIVVGGTSVSSELRYGHLYVPSNFIKDTMDIDINWDKINSTVIITLPDPTVYLDCLKAASDPKSGNAFWIENDSVDNHVEIQLTNGQLTEILALMHDFTTIHPISEITLDYIADWGRNYASPYTNLGGLRIELLKPMADTICCVFFSEDYQDMWIDCNNMDPLYVAMEFIVEPQTSGLIKSMLDEIVSTTPSVKENHRAVVFTIGDKTYYDHGYAKETDSAPYLAADGQVMIPLRCLAEAMRSTVSWDAGTNTATVVLSSGISFAVTLNQQLSYINFSTLNIIKDTGFVEIKNSRLYVPLDFIYEYYGSESWDAEKGVITIGA